MLKTNILDAIELERVRQDLKWGRIETRANAPWLAILMEEVGEVANALLEKKNKCEVEKELIQVAAVAVAWLESRG